MVERDYLEFIHRKSMTEYLESNTKNGILITDNNNIYILTDINDGFIGDSLTTAIKISFKKKEDYYLWVERKKNLTINHYTEAKQIAIDFKFKYKNNIFKLLKNPRKVYFVQNEYSINIEYEDVLSDGKYAWNCLERNINLTKQQEKIINDKLKEFNQDMVKEEIYKDKEYKDVIKKIKALK